ncbi:helix-turn-helix domain-containing protein [Bordetella avium]|uniref:helix-turn-helix domain-containing protein n=1 Tax=Bordetella avium TaxID=521 RepID=UPI000E6898B2|nr:helix-turn-helix domain-containing protein [Bordetella avium]RIQ74559.1 helix-turn-helix domain-containing protein [Bordetella avium]
MSVKVMTMVFDRYPNGGGEMLLALSLADHAHDDGSRIFPSVDYLADKTRQSVRAVQYQLKKMRECGWLIRVSAGHGGRSQSTEYQISPAWIAGESIDGLDDYALKPQNAKFAPFEDGEEKGANGDIKGATDDVKGANHDTKGCNGLHPQRTIKESSESSSKRQAAAAASDARQKTEKSKPEKAQPAKASNGTLSADDLVSEGVDKQVARDWLKVRKDKKLPLTQTAWDGVKSEAGLAGIPVGEAVRVAAENSWAGFRASWYEKQKAEAAGGAVAQDDLAWLKSWPSIVAKGNELGLRQAEGEAPPHFKIRVLKAANLTDEQKARARADHGVSV